jgi:putative endopeptidase
MNNTLLILAASLTLAGCGSESTTEKSDGKVPETENSLEIKESTELGSLDFTAIDSATKPNIDFYQYACGSWLAANPIPEEDSRWSNFNVLGDRNNDVLKNLLENAATNPGSKGESSQLIGDLYNSFVDTNTRNERGISPISDMLEQIEGIATIADLEQSIIELHNQGIGTGFETYVGQDAKLNDRYALHIGQDGLGLPNRDYYFNKDSRSANIREKYKNHLSIMFNSVTGQDGESMQASAYKIEEQLATISWSPVQLRDQKAQYNKMSMADLETLAPGFNWGSYFTGRNISVDSVIVGQTEFMTEFAEMVQEVDLNDWKSYLKWNLINHTASTLSTDLERADFAFYNTVMRGTKKQKELWKRGVMMVTSSPVGEALGEVFVQDNFSQEAKRKIDEMVDNITLVFEERIENLDWMGAETKMKAKEKLGSFARKLGFPDVWKTYEGLSISSNEYCDNMLSLGRFGTEENISKLGTTIDKSEWHMAPQIVNAYYNPLLNEIVFPAGIMQKPFFSEDFEDAVNYARMGAVIGHELTHGFDDQGAQFDASGAMVNWWTKDDEEKFNAKTQKLIDQYNSFEVLEGVFVNGELTLGENIADLGGLTIAYHAYQKSLEGKEDRVINGFTSNQRFFLAFGQVWQNNIRDNALIQRVNTDPHSPGKYRVNGTVANMPEFFEAFDIKAGDPMRQSEEKIARIW